MQQARANGLSEVEGEALLGSCPVMETGNLDFRTQDIVALVARLDIGGTSVDVCVTHLNRSEKPSAALMATRLRLAPTAFTPLAGVVGEISHPCWPRMDRCIDDIWVSEKVRVVAGGTCFDRASADDATLWPSDHAGVWTDLELA